MGCFNLNYFVESLSAIAPFPYAGETPYYLGAIDIFLQALMGLGMIISMLEIEQHNLKKANSQLDTFLYRSSHDLRSPLTTISAIVSVIQHSDDLKEIHKYIRAIDDRVIQADNVIRDIITLRKTQKTGLAIATIDLVEEIEDEFNSLLDSSKKSPSLTIDVPNGITVNTDPARLHMILTNIIGNAIKYDKEEGHSEINVKIGPTEKRGKHRSH